MGEKKGVKEIILVFLILITTLTIVLSETESEIAIDNSPPSQIKTIQNYSWENGSLTNVLDLDNYFKDWENDIISYTVQTLNIIPVTIDSENRISFNPNTTELTDYVAINATDDQFTTQSNTFLIFVGKDVIPPEYKNSYKDKTRVQEGDTIKFTTEWTDERSLSKYTLMINQGLGWEYYTGAFSGREAISETSVEITALSNETVYWKFCAEDTSQNQNCTETYEFTVRKITETENSGEGINNDDEASETEGDEETDGTEVVEATTQSPSESETINDFSLNTKAILLTLIQGSKSQQTIKLTNTGTTKLDFLLTIQAVEQFATISNSATTLEAGESKEITLNFNIPLNATPKDYYGNLVITSFKKELIPIILNINRADLTYSIKIDIENQELNPGEDVTAKITLQNQGDPVLLESDLYYSIKDYYGRIQNFSEEYISFDTGLETTKTLKIPKDATLGEYVFFVSIENQKGIAMNSTSFTVGDNFRLQSLLKYSTMLAIILATVLISAVFFYRYRLKEKRLRSINLYIKLLELQNLINEKKYNEATAQYIKIKKLYKEKVFKNELEDKEKLTKAIEALSKKIKVEEVKKEALAETKPAPAKPTPTPAKPTPTPTKPTPTPTKPTTPTKPAEKTQQPPAKPTPASAKPTPTTPAPAKPTPTPQPKTPVTTQPSKPTTPPKPTNQNETPKK